MVPSGLASVTQTISVAELDFIGHLIPPIMTSRSSPARLYLLIFKVYKENI